MNRTALRWGGYIAFAIVFAIACAYLSNWQFTRNESRERQLALIAANYDAARRSSPIWSHRTDRSTPTTSGAPCG